MYSEMNFITSQLFSHITHLTPQNVKNTALLSFWATETLTKILAHVLITAEIWGEKFETLKRNEYENYFIATKRSI